MWQQIGPGFRMTLVMTILTGLLYPGLVTGLAQLLFPHAANGSLITANGQVIGSSLIGQNFARPEYFHPRPSAAGSDGYDGTASSGSNFGATNQKLIDRVKGSVAKFHQENPDYKGPIPADLLTASGSGLDPHISPASAFTQTGRVAKARNVSEEQVRALVSGAIESRTLGFIGEPRVNVLVLNLALDEKFPKK